MCSLRFLSPHPVSVLRMWRVARDFTHYGEFSSSIMLSARLIYRSLETEKNVTIKQGETVLHIQVFLK